MTRTGSALERPWRGVSPIPILLVTMGTMPISMAFVLTRPILGKMDLALATTSFDHLMVKLVIGILGLGIVIGAPLGALSLRIAGVRLSLSAFWLLFAVAGTLPFLLSDLTLIVLSRFFVGVAVAGVQTAAIMLAAAMFDAERRARWIGIMSGVGVFMSLASTLGSGLLGGISWRFPFLLHLATLPMALLAVRLNTRFPLGEKKPTSPEVTPHVKGTPFPVVLAALAFVVGILSMLPPIYFAFRLSDAGVASPALLAFSFIWLSIPDAVAALCFGALRKRLSANSIFLFAFALAGTGLIIVASAASYAMLIVGMATYGSHIGLAVPNLLNLASADPQKRVRLVSLVTSFAFVSTLFGLVGLDSAFRQLGANGAIIALATVAIAMIAIFLVAVFSRKLRPRPREA